MSHPNTADPSDLSYQQRLRIVRELCSTRDGAAAVLGLLADQARHHADMSKPAAAPLLRSLRSADLHLLDLDRQLGWRKQRWRR